MAEQDFDRDSVDRAFAELVAGYHLTAEHPVEPQPAAGPTATEESAGGRMVPPDPVSLPPAVPVVPLVWRPRPAEADRAADERPTTDEPTTDERYVPDPLPPLARPGMPALVGWAAVLFAAVVVLAAGFGLSLPMWVGWTAVTCFIVGSVVLLTQLPRHRPPGAGDGAVL